MNKAVKPGIKTSVHKKPIDWKIQASKYPDGVFQLNGNLENKAESC